MLPPFEVCRMMNQATGIAVTDSLECAAKTILVDRDPSRSYKCVLYGPLRDEDNRDVRLWIMYRKLEGDVTLQLLVQDQDDDVFLNSNALGAEKYEVGCVRPALGTRIVD